MVDPMEDTQLLRAYLEEGDDSAFAELVRRHQDMVFSACWRKLGDPTRAEDAAQQTFLRLAAKARSLIDHGSLGGWLYKTALGEAANLVRKEQRRFTMETSFRRSLEHEEAQRCVPPEAAAASLLPELDDALLTLKDRDREAIVMRFFENRSLREVGQALGTTEEAARKRVSRAVEQLTGWFENRGLAHSSVAVVTAALLASTSTAPATLAPAAALGAKTTLISLHAASATAAATVRAVVACSLVAAVPIGWQWQGNRQLRQDNLALAERVESLGDSVFSLQHRPVPVMAASALERETASDSGRSKPSKIAPPRERPANLAALMDQQSELKLTASVKALTERLQLTPEQRSSAEQALRAARDLRHELRTRGREAGQVLTFADEQRMLRSDAEAQENLASVLSESQRTALSAFQQEKWAERAESSANAQLRDCLPYLRLTEPQKDSLFTLFAHHASATDPAASAVIPEQAQWSSLLSAADATLDQSLATVLDADQLKTWHDLATTRRTIRPLIFPPQ
jgi:RNA polymerase sigma factor (sigma-70 family)